MSETDVLVRLQRIEAKLNCLMGRHDFEQWTCGRYSGGRCRTCGHEEKWTFTEHPHCSNPEHSGLHEWNEECRL